MWPTIWRYIATSQERLPVHTPPPTRSCLKYLSHFPVYVKRVKKIDFSLFQSLIFQRWIKCPRRLLFFNDLHVCELLTITQDNFVANISILLNFLKLPIFKTKFKQLQSPCRNPLVNFIITKPLHGALLRPVFFLSSRIFAIQFRKDLYIEKHPPPGGGGIPADVIWGKIWKGEWEVKGLSKCKTRKD
jgi:hypothetical protein